MIPDISIIIVNWNACQLLTQCLASIAEFGGGITTEVWVVDNASSDGSPELICEQFPWVKLLANSRNVGFAAANNQAAELCSGRHILLLNPDTLVSADSLRSMVVYMDENTTIGVLGPALRNGDGSMQRSCWYGYPGLTTALSDALFLWKIPRLPVVRSLEYLPSKLPAPVNVDHLLGACMLIRREAWCEVGPLDENYFLFLEETDWCFRAKRAKWRVVYFPLVSITHFGQHSMRQQPARNLPHLYRSYCRFYREHHNTGMPGLLAIKTTFLLGASIRIVIWRMRGARSEHEAGRKLAYDMVNGYRQVIRELATF